MQTENVTCDFFDFTILGRRTEPTLELPPAPSGDSVYEVAGSRSGLGFEQLVAVVAKHLSLGSKFVDDPKNEDSS